MAWHRQGTADFTSGSANVTGAGTGWDNGLILPGDGLRAPDGRTYEIAAVNAAGQITLAESYTGADAPGAAYAIIPTRHPAVKLRQEVQALIDLTETDLEALPAHKVGKSNPHGVTAAQVGAYSRAEADTARDALQWLQGVAETMGYNPVAVALYDTTRDSDPDWVYRCQDKSFYNEPLNTATRGSRREPPVLQAHFVEANRFIIADCDGPVPEMWMIFDGGSNLDMLRGINTGTLSSVAAKNGAISVGSASSGLTVIDLLKDTADFYDSTRHYRYLGNVAQRNDGLDFTGDLDALRIVGSQVNDVTMTVQLGARVDPATGLQIPTIGAGTNGGVSVINDDDTGADITGTGAVNRVHMTQDALWFSGGNVLQRGPIPTADTVDGTWRDWFGSLTVGGAIALPSSSITDVLDGVVGTAAGVAFIHENPSDPAGSMVAYAAHDYATGWMRNPVGCWLADTETGDLVGAELVTNGDFASDLSGWANENSTITWNAGAVDVDRAGNAYGDHLKQSITTVVGQTYVLSFNVIALSHQVDAGFVGGSSILNVTTAGAHSVTFTATGTTTQIRFSMALAVSATATLDNISVRAGVVDRSHNGKGLQAHGTITRTPVATGAEAVAYSGFDNSPQQWLEQPANDDLAFGTGDFYIAGWMQNNAGWSTSYIVDQRDGGGTENSFFLYRKTSSGTMGLHFCAGGLNLAGVTEMPVGVWAPFIALRRSGYLELWVKGELDAVSGVPSTGSITASRLTVGINGLGAQPAGFPLALLRIGAGAPTADQIRKMHTDERHLFQAGAACTLYGASDAVTALARDPDTKLLHAGTSGGRSAFRGLERVEFDADSVAAAISAAQGAVVSA